MLNIIVGKPVGNAGTESGRKATNWVIGDPQFVRKVLSSAEANRLRISRFEREGADLEKLAAKIGKYFEVSLKEMRRRQRGGPGADAQKAFAYYACRVYNAPTTKVGDFLCVGGAAVSAMVQMGEAITEKRNIDI